MNTRIPPDVQRTIGEHLFGGRKIPAIKLYREHSGSDLRTAKNAVEALEAELRAREPGRFTAAPARSGPGCLLVAVMLVAIAVAVTVLLLLRRP